MYRGIGLDDSSESEPSDGPEPGVLATRRTGVVEFEVVWDAKIWEDMFLNPDETAARFSAMFFVRFS